MKLLRMIVIGILISLSCSYILVTLSLLFQPDDVITGTELLEQIIIAVILGAVIGPLSMIFEWERVPLAIQLFIHITAITLCVGIAGYFGEWFVHFGIKNVLLSEVIIYALVWCMMFMLQKKDIEQMNKAISKGKERLR